MLDIVPEIENTVREYALCNGLSVNEAIARAFPSLQDSRSGVRHVQDLLANWQARDGTRVVEPAQSSAALFREWDEEDSQMTEAERRAEDTAWESFKNSINAERAEAGMRLLF